MAWGMEGHTGGTEGEKKREERTRIVLTRRVTGQAHGHTADHAARMPRHPRPLHVTESLSHAHAAHRRISWCALCEIHGSWAESLWYRMSCSI